MQRTHHQIACLHHAAWSCQEYTASAPKQCETFGIKELGDMPLVHFGQRPTSCSTPKTSRLVPTEQLSVSPQRNYRLFAASGDHVDPRTQSRVARGGLEAWALAPWRTSFRLPGAGADARAGADRTPDAREPRADVTPEPALGYGVDELEPAAPHAEEEEVCDEEDLSSEYQDDDDSEESVLYRCFPFFLHFPLVADHDPIYSV
jgi:hypothetical protein